MDVQRLRDDDEDALRALLLTDPVANLFLLSYVEGYGVAVWPWLGVRRGGALTAVALLLPGRLAVPWAPDPDDARALGAGLRDLGSPTMMVGPRAAVDTIWAGWADAARVDRWYDQRLYTIERPPAVDRRGPPIRLAREDESEQIAALSAAMEAEDLGRRPLEHERDRFLETVGRRLRTGSTWVIERGGAIVFLIHAGARTPWGVQVGGTYVPPEQRGRGIGSWGTRAVVRELLRRHPRVTLHVNEANTAAVRCYERAGFRPHAAFRLITLPEGPA